MACRDRQVKIGGDPLIVGILNLTHDSFFDGGNFVTLTAALAHADNLAAEGAAMIDVGGQSTRPGHMEVSAAEEISRVVPVISALTDRVPVPLSVDTYKPEVARAALRAGAHVINDIHGLQRSPEMARIAAEFDCPVIVMHQETGFDAISGETIERMKRFFTRSLEIAGQAGVARERVILDPGIGFAKTDAQNLEILGRLSEFKAFGCPLLVGASRKSFIGRLLDLPPDERLEGSLATTALAVWQGVEFIRAHDVRGNLRAAKIARAIRQLSNQ